MTKRLFPLNWAKSRGTWTLLWLCLFFSDGLD